MLVAGKFAWVPHVKLPVKCPWYSGKFTRACRQFAYILREVLAASTQVNVPVFTGKLHITRVNCMWGLFTCELHAPVLQCKQFWSSFRSILLIRQVGGLLFTTPAKKDREKSVSQQLAEKNISESLGVF